MKQRKLYKQIVPYLEHKNAIVIIGARQVGKTTLLQHIYEQFPDGQKVWFDLENPLHQKYFEDIDYDAVYKNILSFGLDPRAKKYVFIDEIQNFPAITKIIKYCIDHYHIKFFVTGSSSFYMKNLFPESLAGRKFVFHLYPLDFEEFLYFKGHLPDWNADTKIGLEKKSLIEFKKYKHEFDEYTVYGGFPEVSLSSSRKEKKLILENIFKSFFEKDILQLSDYQDVKEIRDLILLLAQRVGSKLDVTRLSSEMGVNRYKIYSYLEFLQATFLVSLVGMYTKSIDRKIAGGKKIYFVDTGLLNAISKISEGALFENAVFNIVSRYGDITYYTTGSKEIDFILDNEKAFEVEVKANSGDIKTLKEMAEKIHIKESYVISRTFVEKVNHVVYPQCL